MTVCSTTRTEPGISGGESVTYEFCCSKVYSQTLFLGCSVQSFVVALGWGEEGSRLTVQLVRDTCKYPFLTDYIGNRVERPTNPNHYTENRKNNTFSKDENGVSLIPGKVYYQPDGDKLVSMYHYDEDPGFYGDMPDINGQTNPDTFDIIGAPVYFKYDDFEFNGIVKSWEKGADQSTVSNSYTVIIETPTFLLRHTNMILSSYTGSVFTKTAGYNFGFPRYEFGTYQGKIAEQNIPNLINVYGFLEDNTDLATNMPLFEDTNVPLTAYGKSGRNEEGIPAVNIIAGINVLLDYQPVTEALTKQKILRYSPYGRIIGKAIKNKDSGNNINVQSAIAKKMHMGIIWPFIYNGNYGNEHRMSYDIDISELNSDNIIPYSYRISDDKLTILEFITRIAEDIGKEIFITLDLRIEQGIVYPILKLNTISTLEYGRLGAVKSFIDYLNNDTDTLIQSYNSGIEYNTSDPVRSMYIGGKQQRLYQFRNKKYASKQTSLRYNAYTNTFININHGELNSVELRAPDPTSYRNPALHYDRATAAGNISGRVYLPGFSEFNAPTTFGKSIQKGNYYNKFSQVVTGILPDFSDIGMHPAINWIDVSSTDTICPYFGNNLITNLVRRVYRHTTGFIVEFTQQEIALAIGQNFGTNDIVGVSETEIRAAMAGFDNFYGFIFGVMNDAKNIGRTRPDKGNVALQIYSKVIMPLFNIPNNHDIGTYFNVFNRGVSETSNKLNNSLSGSQAVPIAPSSSLLSDERAYDILSKLHKFFADIGNTYYGKQFMVGLSSLKYWRDGTSFTFDGTGATDCQNSLVIGFTDAGDPIYVSQGSNKIYYSFEPADFAWEEPFNYIDDLLVVGSPDMDQLTADNGTIYPILGYSSNFQYNYIRDFDKRVWDVTKTYGANQLFNFWKYDVYKNAGIIFDKMTTPADDAFWEPSISLQDDSSITLRYNKTVYINPSSPGALCSRISVPVRQLPQLDAFNKTIPDQFTFKTYVKAEVDKEIQSHFVNGNIVPKVIIKHNTGAFINPLHPAALSVTTAISEFLGNNLFGINGIIASKVLSGSSLYAVPNQIAGYNINNVLGQNKDNIQYNNMSIAPKAAMPIFAGVPMILNNAVYGPWISAPDIIKNNLFENNPDIRIENLVGGTNIEVDADLVPWNYGSMRLLDEAAIIKTASNNNYNLQSETGQLTVNGAPILKVGDELKAVSYQFNGPTVNNINVQINQNGPTTTYTFRTFTRKFTLFNKENSDLIRTVGQNALKANKELRQQFRKISDQLLQMSLSQQTFGNPYDLSGSKLTQYSPMTVLVGYSHPYISPRTTVNPGFYPSPTSPVRFSRDSIRQLTTVSLQDVRELPQEFDHLYSSKSFMSLDGLLSPVSFYPTLNGSTNAYKSYYTANCPFCNGTKFYTVASKTLWCQYCSDKKAGEEPVAPINIKIPPYILSSQLTDDIINNPNAIEALVAQSSKKIDYINLNPIIMPVGELRNKFAQDSDFTSHHIDIIGRSLVPMAGSLSITDNTAIIKENLTNLSDQNGGGFNGVPPSDLDWNAYYFDIDNNLQPNNYYLMNQRFMALRGPLVISGWGFDTDGYPVPNASGEPKVLDGEGYPLRISSPYDAQGGFQNYPGTILGKNQTWNNEKGRWNDPYREDQFYKGWGLRPDTWPVGPVDLRWDYTRKVWTVGEQTVFAEVQLEEDLIPVRVARGFLNTADKQNPLPNNLRRMVFVKDDSETYGAPRGAKLYCMYDRISGFYIPLSRQNIITSGVLLGGNNAIIYNGYAKGYDPNIQGISPPDALQVTFNNFMNFPITPSQKAMFIYLSSNGWVLMNTRCE